MNISRSSQILQSIAFGVAFSGHTGVLVHKAAWNFQRNGALIAANSRQTMPL